MIVLLVDLAWAFVVMTFYAGMAVIVMAGALAVYLEVTGS